MVKQEGDEYVCTNCTCGKGGMIRWGIDDVNDVCPNGPNYQAPPSPPPPPPPNLIRRVCDALDREPTSLARLLGVTYSTEILPLLDVKDYELSDLDMEETFVLLDDYVNKKLGLLLAIRADTQAILQKHRTARAMRRAEIKDRP